MTGDKGRAEWLTEGSLLLAVLFLGTNPVAVKVAVSEVPPLPFVTMRFTLAGVLLLFVVLPKSLGGGHTRGRVLG